MSQQPLDYEPFQPRGWINRHLVVVIAASAVLGVAWNIGAVSLMGGGPLEALRPSWFIAGLAAGIAAGLFTVWSRTNRKGRESFWLGVGNYYFAIFVYWLVFLVIERVHMCIQWGGWTDFDLHDHVKLLAIFAVFGTIPWGLILIPLCFASRHLVWRVYGGRAAT